MPPQFILGLLVIGAFVLFLNAFLKASPAHVAKKIKQIGFYVAIGFVVLLAIVKLNWIIAVIGALFALLPRLMPLLRYLPILKWVQNWRKGPSGFGNTQQSSQSTQTNSSQSSKVSARYITMTLNHESGELDGEIIEGQFAGQRLSTLSKEAIIQFHKECLANDNESAALVETYLNRIYGDTWSDADHQSHQQSSPNTKGNMSNAEALEILGLAKGASKKEIIAAHRLLVQKVHPDRGGSNYLAAKINQAKDILIK
ncbi:MAG: molecular chaperone DnaJ [Gammaproteobacteria bacterium]|nr:MAG: molecular chaperone DnaJ [Gammaproteobacteria bacterium]